MIEIELFYKIVESHIRAVHTEYLQGLKRVPTEQKAEKRRFFGLFKRKKISVEDKLLKGYNKGIETALSILVKEFKRFDKRLKKEEKAGRKF